MRMGKGEKLERSWLSEKETQSNGLCLHMGLRTRTSCWDAASTAESSALKDGGTGGGCTKQWCRGE